MEGNDMNCKSDDILEKMSLGRRTFLKGLTILGLGGLGAGLARPISGMAAESSPMQKKGKFLVEPSRKTPVIREVDILVVGGGIAGVTAALAAGRMGLKTLLVDYFGCLGGNASIGLVNTFCGFYTKESLVPIVKGVGGEIVQAMIDKKAAQAKGWYLPFDPEILKLVLEEKAAEAKVEL